MSSEKALTFVTHYQNAFLRFLHSFFVQMPCLLWFKFLSWPLPQNTLDAGFSIWWAAQKNLAENNFTLSAYGNVPHPPDKRALTVQPRGVELIYCPDEPISNLVKLNAAWGKHTDPSGTILQSSGFDYNTVHAFTICGKHARVYAAASEIPSVLQYEFENIILARLGYDVSDR